MKYNKKMVLGVIGIIIILVIAIIFSFFSSFLFDVSGVDSGVNGYIEYTGSTYNGHAYAYKNDMRVFTWNIDNNEYNVIKNWELQMIIEYPNGVTESASYVASSNEYIWYHGETSVSVVFSGLWSTVGVYNILTVELTGDFQVGSTWYYDQVIDWVDDQPFYVYNKIDTSLTSFTVSPNTINIGDQIETRYTLKNIGQIQNWVCYRLFVDKNNDGNKDSDERLLDSNCKLVSSGETIIGLTRSTMNAEDATSNGIIYVCLDVLSYNDEISPKPPSHHLTDSRSITMDLTEPEPDPGTVVGISIDTNILIAVAGISTLSAIGVIFAIKKLFFP